MLPTLPPQLRPEGEILHETTRSICPASRPRASTAVRWLALGALERDGYIRIEERAFVVTDMAGLREAADA